MFNLNLRYLLIFAAFMLTAAFGQPVQIPATLPTAPMTTLLDFRSGTGSPGRRSEPNPNGLHQYTLNPTTNPGLNYTPDSGCYNPTARPWVFQDTVTNGVHSLVDQSGNQIYRFKGLSNVSTALAKVRGFEILATFGSSGFFDESAFFSESPCYIGDIEYGFSRNAATNLLDFYWATNANCPEPAPDGSECHEEHNTSSPLMHSTGGSVRLSGLKFDVGDSIFNTGQKDYYGAFLYFDSAASRYRFYVRIRDGSSGAVKVTIPAIDLCPAGEPCDFGNLMPTFYNTGNGYLTTTLGKYPGQEESLGGGAFTIDPNGVRVFYAPTPPVPGFDFNSDGKADILWQHPSTGELVAWIMNGSAWAANAPISGSTEWRVPAAADFNGDGTADILWQHPSTGELWVWFMNNSTRIGQTSISPPTTWRVVGTGDFNGDGKADIVWQHPSTGELWVWFMDGPTWTGQAQLSPPTAWKVVATADFNGDGKADIVWQHPATGELWVWFMNGVTGSGQIQISPSTPWRVQGTGDYNGDGKPDILWQLPSSGELWVWYMNGAAWAGQAPISGPTPWTAIGWR